MSTTTADATVDYVSAIERELRESLGYDSPADGELPMMLYYHMGWEHLDQTPAVAGKRLRPLLTILCAGAAGADWRLALPFAASVELIHNFSLVHDDIQDGSPLRRGRAAVWTKWGEAQAINAGDALFSYAHLAAQRAEGLPSDTRLKALAILDDACVGLSMGQYMDIVFETYDRTTADEYLEMIKAKTARLMAAAAHLGALAAGAPEELCDQYRSFGRHLGVAFQIRDDLLGIWGDAAVTGKPASSDIESRKKTLPVVYGLEHSAELRREYQSADGGEAPDAAVVVQLLESTGARDYAETEERRHAHLALEHLAKARPRGEDGDRLGDLTLSLLRRTS